METYRAKIARLEAKRDRALRSAPRLYLLQLLWKPLILLVFAVICFAGLHQFVDHFRLGSPWSTLNELVYLAMLGLVSVLFGRAGWLLWRVRPPANGDLWAYADKINYESDDDYDPHVLQARIDAIRAQNADQDAEAPRDRYRQAIFTEP
jgi:hypothetical protein